MKPAAERLPIAMRDCGMTPKGKPLARIIWGACEQIFAAAPDAPPFEVADLVSRLARCWAGDVEIDRQNQRVALRRTRKGRTSQ
jgi:hypothetical protein